MLGILVNILKSFCTFALLIWMAAVANAYQIAVPESLNPGDQYKLIFLTSQTTDAFSSDIQTYNQFASNLAETVFGLRELDADWFAVGSTASIDARDNTLTNPLNSLHSDVPIFLVVDEHENETLIATGNSDLWDGVVGGLINRTQNGSLVGIERVWTGHNRFWDCRHVSFRSNKP